MSTTYRKKLIEVALPLEAINAASAREKSIRHGHPSAMHLWWARRPLAAARAVLFAQLVDDPSSWTDLFPTEEAQNHERQRLFRLIEELVQWENTNNETVINAARLEIARSHARSFQSLKAKAILAEGVTPDIVNEYLATELQPVHDPFAGGGTIPLEAQRLGLRAVATDLNPVAVLINKALIEIPPQFAGRPPVNPDWRDKGKLRTWRGAEGLAEDVRYYGAWMREEAKKLIGHLYPKVDLPKEHGGGGATVIAWLWARTVESPNPAFKGCHVPLVSSFWLSRRPGAEAWAEPVVNGRDYSFRVQQGQPPDVEAVARGTKSGRGASFTCVLSNTPIDPDYIKAETLAGRAGARLVAIVAAGDRRRIFLTATEEQETTALGAQPRWAPDAEFAKNSRHMTPWAYGLDNFGKLFTRRQLVALDTHCDLLPAIRELVLRDGGAADYAIALVTYLALSLSKSADLSSALCFWQPNAEHLKIAPTFSRHALAMTWDHAEGNPFSDSSGNYFRQVELIGEALAALPSGVVPGQATLASAAEAGGSIHAIISTDPPYYDNVPYADLSDFFYVWLRRALRHCYPELFTTLLTPKTAELVADQFRHGSRDEADAFFTREMSTVLAALNREHETALPATIYYAFKQTEAGAATGWAAFLEAVLNAGFSLVGTLPVRTERPGRFRETGSNALASSIVLVTRNRAQNATTTTRGEFRRELRRDLPEALKRLQQGNIAPVDVAQASIGPGMAIFSRHKQVLEADGKPVSVRTALQLINEVLDEYLASGEGDFDADTRFAITWYEQHGWEPGPFGDAETLAKARNVSVGGVVEAGICKSAAGKVRILKRPEMRPLDYDPAGDERPTIWEFAQHMIRNLEDEGEEAAARLLKKLGSAADATRELAYRLYNTCERKKWAEDARSYNALILAWAELEKLAARMGDEPLPAMASKPSKGANGKKKISKTKAAKKGQQALFEGDE